MCIGRLYNSARNMYAYRCVHSDYDLDYRMSRLRYNISRGNRTDLANTIDYWYLVECDRH
jgi:hypothetical protein